MGWVGWVGGGGLVGLGELGCRFEVEWWYIVEAYGRLRGNEISLGGKTVRC